METPLARALTEKEEIQGHSGDEPQPPHKTMWATYKVDKQVVASSMTHGLRFVDNGRFLTGRVRIGSGFVTFTGWNPFALALSGVDPITARFLDWLLTTWLDDAFARRVRSRMNRPQRHRLLHGYPPRTMLREPRTNAPDAFLPAEHPGGTNGRGLIVGVLPHPFCNPAVEGCGFCTFPHEAFTNRKAQQLAEGVVREIAWSAARAGGERRRVEAIYFGGGTANLTPADAFRAIGAALADAFDTTDAEISLEGVPSYFLKRKPLLMDVLAETLPAARRRISMGIQTFDPAMRARMGRTGFGDEATFAEVVRAAHDRGFGTSGDLLINLPGQTLDRMHDDLERAAALGLDQVCLYHLVMFEGLNMPWSADANLLIQLPNNPSAAAHWIELRRHLIDLGYDQVTLTNFERREARDSSRSYRYEVAAKRPETVDMLGFGPAGISFVADADFTQGWKAQAPTASRRYLERTSSDWLSQDLAPWERRVHLTGDDLPIAYLVRKVALLSIDRAAYRERFGVDVLQPFRREFEALADAGLVEIDDSAVRLTPSGMFYSDTVASLFWWRHERRRRYGRIRQSARRSNPGSMG